MKITPNLAVAVPDQVSAGVSGPRPATACHLPIGQLLVEDGVIGQDDLNRALAFQQTYRGRLGAILVRLGAVAEDRLLAVLSRQLNLPVISGDLMPIDSATYTGTMEASGYGLEWWLDQEALVWRDVDGQLVCVARDPIQPSLQECVAAAYAEPVLWGLVLTQDLDRTLDLLQQSLSRGHVSIADEISHLRELAEEAPVVELVNNVVSQAFNERASDVHIEPGERQFRVRYRIDGVLQTRLSLPRDRFDAVASRVKLISGLDIAERRLPQDGRLSMRISGEEIDIRVSSLPGTWGESLVMRLLPKERREFRLDLLGMAGGDLERYRGWVREPHGIILVTGPTGSGKSTTLYATLEEINDGTSKIITVEEPVEYNIPGVNQVQAHAEIGYTFARALRAILRQDPDRIMIGEIRDLETAEIAVQSALTGHMVFSTLHTNDALSAFTRLIDMGVEPFLIASSVRAVMAQRLVRRLCDQCAVPETVAPQLVQQMTELQRRDPSLITQPPAWRRAVGCPTCQGIGYRGRLGIYELVGVTPELHDGILKRSTAHDLNIIARDQGYHTLREDGLVKAWQGQTTVEEVLRVTGLSV
ncbi:MAG: ATPase, T2SS/T4P/T4SS family [Acidobacteriaceae bacterium]|nr:ATPase, T2SS/T4P/T4SS family [Acidobacteriaceae bacterium]